MSHFALISSDRQAIATRLIALFESEADDAAIARNLASIDTLAALGHLVTRADLVGLARWLFRWYVPEHELARMVRAVVGRFADDEQAAAVLPLDLAALVGVLRPVLGVPARSAD